MTLFQPSQELLLATSIPVPPKVKGRPRFTKNGKPYTDQQTKQAEEAVRAAFLTAAPDWEPYEQPCDVRWQFTNDGYFLEIWSAEDYTSRKLRGDTDNYMKLSSDALNKVAWLDDRLIVRTSGEKL